MESMIRSPRGFGSIVEAEVLVSSDPFSPRYDLDRGTGVVSRKGHAIEGQSIVGKILVIPTAKGGVAAGWAFYDLKQRGLAPAAIVCQLVNPVFVQGCVLAGIPIVHKCTPSAASLQSGDIVRLDPRKGELRMIKPMIESYGRAKLA